MLKSTTRSKFARSLLGTAALTSLLTGCAAIDRIKQLGEPVALAPIDNPTAKPGYKPVQMPMPTPQPASYNPIRCGATGRARSSTISARTSSAIF